jgi:hypothetical protein
MGDLPALGGAIRQRLLYGVGIEKEFSTDAEAGESPRQRLVS